MYHVEITGTTGWNGTEYSVGLNYDDSIRVAKMVGGKLANIEQLHQIAMKGSGRCRWGWLDNATVAMAGEDNCGSYIPGSVYILHNSAKGLQNKERKYSALIVCQKELDKEILTGYTIKYLGKL